MTFAEASGIKVELDVDRLGQQVARQVAAHLAELFPSDPAEFWAALCDQAYRERQRVAAMLDLTCPHQEQCPHKPDVLSGLSFEGEPGERTGSDETRPAPLDPAARHERGRTVGRRARGDGTTAG